ncbi:MAG: hypothetical protein IJ618_03600 [Prevotella sp.]|nr:hypothetical protein [Prevotella sp.]
MKIRLGSLLNDLNITLDTAKERLKKTGKEYTLNTVVSENEIKMLSSYSHSLAENTISTKAKKKKKAKANNKQAQKPVSLKKSMTSGKSFSSCATNFNINQKEIEMFAEIKKEMKRLFGDDLIVSKLPLFKTKVIKGINVNYKYHYYAMNGHKVLIKNRCIATWLASIFSEAVNQERISKADYRQIYKTYLWKYIQSMKKKSVMPQKRPWVSVVSVPFGGMNRR